jgi:site-specific recombinase XerD
MKVETLPAVIDPAGRWDGMPPLVARAGGGAAFAWDELFAAQLRNPHTRRAYGHAVRQFLGWCEVHALELGQITPRWVGEYYDQLPVSIPTKKQHLAALRCFFDRLVLRHAVPLNPAASVRGERYSLAEGKTPEISVEQERALLGSIRADDIAGQRDRAIVAVLIYTAARIGAVARLQIGNFASDGSQWMLNFLEKGGKARIIPARDDLRLFLTAYLDAAGLWSARRGEPLFRRLDRRTGAVTPRAMTADDMGRMLKRRMAALGFPTELCPHSFRVATITDLLSQGVPLEDVQNLVGHADPRTTRLYDRRPKRVMRSVVDRISV